MMKKILFTAGTALLFTTGVQADTNPNTGCGLGSVIIDNQNTVAKQVIAATLNGLSGNQTFGITSGTVGCDKPTLLVSNEKVERFVADNMDTLATDIAVGEGETLSTLAKMLNVKDEAAFEAKLKASFSSIYPNEEVSSAQVIDAIVRIAG